jgi:hypothetical protein
MAHIDPGFDGALPVAEEVGRVFLYANTGRLYALYLRNNVGLFRFVCIHAR